MENNLKWLKELNDIGFWNIISTIILISGSIIGLFLIHRRHKKFADINIYITWKRDENNRFPLVIHFEIRNFSHKILVLSSAKFKFDKLIPGKYAHCDTISQEYEIKFRHKGTDIREEIITLLKHGDIATTYVPLEEYQTDEDLYKLSNDRRMGFLFLTITFIEKKPKVRFLKIKLANVVENKEKLYDFNKPQN